MLKLDPSEETEIHLMLSDAARCDAVPKIAEAIAENRAALANADASPELRQRARVQQIELLLAQGKLREATAVPPVARQGRHRR